MSDPMPMDGEPIEMKASKIAIYTPDPMSDPCFDNVAHGVCSTHQGARELTSSLMAHLFFHDGSGRSRIGSYDGRGSLRTWLATIIKHQVINQRQLKSSESVSLDSLRNTASARGASELEAAVLRNKYREAIADSFKAAAEQLSERERLVLVLRFEDEMAATEIAHLLDVHPSQITRTVKLAHRRGRLGVRRAMCNSVPSQLCAELV